MTRAEKAASEAYGGVPQLRRAFINGYEKAEKDLALTWEDMKLIVGIADDMLKGMTAFEALHRFPLETIFYEEVLRRFNEQR